MSLNSSSGLITNLSNTLTDELIKGADAVVVNGEDYSNGQAFQCGIPNGEIARSQSFPAGTLVGFYDIRVFYAPDTIIDPYTHLLTLQVYEDGQLKQYTTGNSVNGEIRLDYLDQTQTIGSRVKLWFDPTKNYELVLKTSPTMDSTYNIILDYIRFEHVKHDNPFMNWINASEVTGGDLWAIDTGIDSITGNNTALARGTIYTNYVFKEIYYADVNVLSSTGNYNSNPYTLGTDSFYYSVREVRETPWTANIEVRWFCIGIIELPLVRPL